LDLIGLLIFLYIMFRSASDKKKEKQRTAPQRKVGRGFGQPSPEELEDLLGKFFGVEGNKADDSNNDFEESYTIPVKPVIEPIKPSKHGNLKLVRSNEVKTVPEKVAVNKPVVAEKPVLPKAKGLSLTEVDLRKAIIWSEILQKPKALRHRN